MKEKMICRGDLFYYDFGDNSGSVHSMIYMSCGKT